MAFKGFKVKRTSNLEQGKSSEQWKTNVAKTKEREKHDSIKSFPDVSLSLSLSLSLSRERERERERSLGNRDKLALISP